MFKISIISTLLIVLLVQYSCIQHEKPIYSSTAFNIYGNRVEQAAFIATATSETTMTSNYNSQLSESYGPTIEFKFSINERDNEMEPGKNHKVTLQPNNGACITELQFGKQLIANNTEAIEDRLPADTKWTIQLDMRAVLNSFKNQGYYTLCDGEKLDSADFKGVYIAGGSAPLIWDFNNLGNKKELQLLDPDHDGVFETTLTMNVESEKKHTATQWKVKHDLSAFAQYHSDNLLDEAIYNLAIDEMINAVEPDSTFRTGKEWAGVWTRDISYSIILSMAQLQPKVAEYSLLRKVKNGRIIQDTGTGGAYPISTDRMIWAVAAWELYKVTGDQDWLHKAYPIIKSSLDDDQLNAMDNSTGMMRGESSFLDWREQTYPRWMTPVDIYESENLGTNAVHYQANRVLSQMAELLSDTAASHRYNQIAEQIRNGINDHLWMEDKGYYGQYLYGRNFKTLSPRSEALGEALCVWFGIANEEQQNSVICHVPVTDFGITCIYPQIPGIPPYHNNAVWPFVQSYWALASAKAGNDASVLASIAAIYRPAALFLTNKENFVADNGDFAGTQINSGNMLWSLSGSLALVHKVLFGIDFQSDSLHFHPFIPKALAGKRVLTNFKCRDAILDIEIEGFGNQIQSFELDATPLPQSVLPYSLTGKHKIRIIMANNELGKSTINQVYNHTSPDVPTVRFFNGNLSWSPVKGAISYQILRNGVFIQNTSDTAMQVSESVCSEYQVIALDKRHTPSFASEPAITFGGDRPMVYQMENFADRSNRKYKNFRGTGFIEISKTKNRTITLPVMIKHDGTYAIYFRYSNGNGAINTENKCAIRTLSIDKKRCGTIVMPQRGTNEWSNWGVTNSVIKNLHEGNYRITLSIEAENENMNGEINEAMVDEVTINQIQ